MEHFKLDALEKTILALAFKLGSRSDLRTKGTPECIFVEMPSNTLQLMQFFL